MSDFFLNRYKDIDPSVTLIDPATIKQAIRITKNQEKVKTILRKKGAKLEKIPFLKHGYFATAPFSLGATPEYLLGQYYIQGPLSQLTCEILNPTGPVLDMAAAPGGKTTYLAEITPAHVVALDKNARRLASVRNNVERLGLPNVICVKKDARFATDLNETFPFILLDAPCSGNYCSEENWFAQRTLEDVKKNARLQRELITAAYRCLAPGGRLLYSTCSLELEENEMLLDWALKKFETLTLVPLDIPIGDPGHTKELDPRLAGTRRFWPHKTGMEGFFIALLEKQ